MFDKKKIKDVAQLAMIAVDDNDLSYFSSEISEFLKTVEQMDAINLSEINPTKQNILIWEHTTQEALI